MPASCKGHYVRLAVMWSPGGGEPKQIRDYGRNADPDAAPDWSRPIVVCTWERLHVGRRRSAYHKALAEAQTFVAAMNGPEWPSDPNTSSGP